MVPASRGFTRGCSRSHSGDLRRVLGIGWKYAAGRFDDDQALCDRPESLAKIAARSKGLRADELGGVAVLARSPELRAEDREFEEAAVRAIAELPHELREAFTLRFWKEFSYDQIAELQGVEPGLARWRYFSARRRLHQAQIVA